VATLGRIGALIWSLASFWSGLSGSFASFLGSRLLLGVGEAPTFPGNAKAIAAWFPRSERGLATAIFDSAAKLGTGIAIPLVSVVAAQRGWRWAIYFTGGLSFVFFLLFYAFYRSPSRDARLGDTEREYIAAGGGSEETAEPGERGAPLGYLLRNRKVWG